MIRHHRSQFGFVHHEGLMLIAFAGISLGLFLPVVKRSLDFGFSWWLSTLLGLGLVALFWLAFSTVAIVFVQVALWLEKRQR